MSHAAHLYATVEAHYAGRDAFAAGAAYDDNPHDPSESVGRAWSRGWRYAEGTYVFPEGTKITGSPAMAEADARILAAGPPSEDAP